IGWIAALIWSTNRDVKPLEELPPEPRYRARNGLVVAVTIAGFVLTFQVVRIYLFDYDRNAAASTPQLKIDPTTVRITRYDLHKDLSGIAAKADFTIRNINGFKVKNIVVNCVYATIDGTVLDSSTKTIPGTIEPYFNLRVTDFDMGSFPSQTANSSCSATGFS